MIKLRLKRPSRMPRFGLSALVFALFALLLLFKLGSLPAFLTSDETAATAGSNWRSLSANPMFAPWHLMQDLLLHINNRSVFVDRLPSATFGLAILMAFYWALRNWFGKPISYLATILLGTTPLFLILARQARPDIMYFVPVLLIAAYLTAVRATSSLRWPLSFLIISLSVSLYVPGGIWLVAVGLVYKRAQLTALVKSLSRQTRLITALALLILLSPLIAGLIAHPGIYKSMLLVPERFDIVRILKDWAWMISSLILRTKVNQSIVLGQLPVLDAVQIGLGFFGGYVMWSKLRTQFYWLFGAVLFLCLLAATRGGYTALGLVLPLLGIVAGMGLRYLYVEWMHVFPKNPLPRYFAYTLMAAVVLIHVMYGVRYSLVAWPARIAATTVHVLK